MVDENVLGIIFAVGVVIGVVAGAWSGATIQKQAIQNYAVKIGVAEYYIDKSNEKTFHYFIEPKE